MENAIDLTNPTVVTEGNIEDIRAELPCDMRDQLAVGCEVWRRGEPEQRTMLRFPDGCGAVCQGANSVWGSWDGDIFISDDADEIDADGNDITR